MIDSDDDLERIVDAMEEIISPDDPAIQSSGLLTLYCEARQAISLERIADNLEGQALSGARMDAALEGIADSLDELRVLVVEEIGDADYGEVEEYEAIPLDRVGYFNGWPSPEVADD